MKKIFKIAISVAIVGFLVSFFRPVVSATDVIVGQPYPDRQHLVLFTDEIVFGGNDFYVGRSDLYNKTREEIAEYSQVYIAEIDEYGNIVQELEFKLEEDEFYDPEESHLWFHFVYDEEPEAQIGFAVTVLEGDVSSTRNYFLEVMPTTMKVSEFKKIQSNPLLLSDRMSVRMYDIDNDVYVEDYTLETDISILDVNALSYPVQYSFEDQGVRHYVESLITFDKGLPPKIEIPPHKVIDLSISQHYDPFEDLVITDVEDDANMDAPDLVPEITGVNEVQAAILNNQDALVDVIYKVIDYDNNMTTAIQTVQVISDANKGEKNPDDNDNPDSTKPITPEKKDPVLDDSKDDLERRENESDEKKVKETEDSKTSDTYTIEAENMRVALQYVESLRDEDLIILSGAKGYLDQNPQELLDISVIRHDKSDVGIYQVDFYLTDNPNISISRTLEVYQDDSLHLNLSDVEMKISDFSHYSRSTKLEENLLRLMKAEAYQLNNDGTKTIFPIYIDSFLEHETSYSRIAVEDTVSKSDHHEFAYWLVETVSIILGTI